MVLPPTGSVRIVRSALRGRAAALALASEVGASEWGRGAMVLKQDERTSVFAGEAEADGVRRGIVVKVMRADRFKDHLSRMFGRTRLMRQWRGAQRLLAAGVATPECFALWRGEGGVECLAMERIEGRTLLREMARGKIGARGQHRLAREAGSMVAELARHGVYNRDHKPSNVMVRWVGDVPDLCLIDPVGVRGSTRGGTTAMLAKLVIECLGVGARPKRTLMMRALRACGDALGWDRAKRKREWRIVEYVVGRHGDPRPKVDPLQC